MLESRIDFSNKKIAFVHDWLTGMRGGERVLEEMIRIFGPRDIYTLVLDKESISPLIASCPIHTSFLQNFWGVPQRHQWWLPLFPMAIESFDFSGYDLVISTSHCVAKGIVTTPRVFHYCYLFTPVRYAWDFCKVYQEAARPRWLMQFVWPANMHCLRQWDVNSANRVDHFCSISEYVARRVRKYYRRESEVIHPPVELSRFSPSSTKGDYYFVLSALVPYKRIDLAVEACVRSNRRLIVAGTGPEEARLKQMASGSRVEFVGRVSDLETQTLYREAKAFLFPGEEDYGITPLESQASGVPVIAYGAGGALETVSENQSGIFFREQTADSLLDALDLFESMEFSKENCILNAKRFDPEPFRLRFRDSVEEAYLKFYAGN
ncbi:MAG: glycosyltransferase [Candidatus Cloacimonetes bacterium]|nr:glycosyltransferase [Candidatus Cloacimonadota bacterium]